MDEQAHDFLRTFSGAMSVIKMYGIKHQQFQNALTLVFERLQDIFQSQDEFVFGIIEGEIIYGDQLLFKLGQLLTMLIEHFEKKNIERIHFLKGLTKEELSEFIAFIVSSDETDEKPQESLEMRGISNIRVSQLMVGTADIERKKEEEGHSNYERALNSIAGVKEKFKKGDVAPRQLHSSLRSAAGTIVSKLRTDFPQCLNEECAQKIDGNVVHALNTALLSAHVTSQIGFSSQEVVETCLAVLLCFCIGPADDHAQRDLSISFSQRYSKACAHAKAMWLYKDVFGVLPVLMAFEQGLPYHDTARSEEIGFPQKPHILSMIMALCDLYDRHWSVMPNQADRISERICDNLRNNYGDWFQPQLMDRFAHIMGSVKF